MAAGCGIVVDRDDGPEVDFHAESGDRLIVGRAGGDDRVC